MRILSEFQESSLRIIEIHLWPITAPPFFVGSCLVCVNAANAVHTVQIQCEYGANTMRTRCKCGAQDPYNPRFTSRLCGFSLSVKYTPSISKIPTRPNSPRDPPASGLSERLSPSGFWRSFGRLNVICSTLTPSGRTQIRLIFSSFWTLKNVIYFDNTGELRARKNVQNAYKISKKDPTRAKPKQIL